VYRTPLRARGSPGSCRTGSTFTSMVRDRAPMTTPRRRCACASISNAQVRVTRDFSNLSSALQLSDRTPVTQKRDNCVARAYGTASTLRFVSASRTDAARGRAGQDSRQCCEFALAYAKAQGFRLCRCSVASTATSPSTLVGRALAEVALARRELGARTSSQMSDAGRRALPRPSGARLSELKKQQPRSDAHRARTRARTTSPRIRVSPRT